jgi:ATP synthase protein I
MPDQYGLQVDVSESGLEAQVQPLTPEQAAVLRPKIVGMSPWSVIGVQAMTGLLVILAIWLMSGQDLWGVSASYGVLAVLLPAMLFARGLSRRRRAPTASQALLEVLFWEFVKIVVTVAMLMAAPKLVMGLNWLALLVGFVVTMKASWLAMFWWHRRAASSTV